MSTHSNSAGWSKVRHRHPIDGEADRTDLGLYLRVGVALRGTLGRSVRAARGRAGLPHLVRVRVGVGVRVGVRVRVRVGVRVRVRVRFRFRVRVRPPAPSATRSTAAIAPRCWRRDGHTRPPWRAVHSLLSGWDTWLGLSLGVGLGLGLGIGLGLGKKLGLGLGLGLEIGLGHPCSSQAHGPSSTRSTSLTSASTSLLPPGVCALTV